MLYYYAVLHQRMKKGERKNNEKSIAMFLFIWYSMMFLLDKRCLVSLVRGDTAYGIVWTLGVML